MGNQEHRGGCAGPCGICQRLVNRQPEAVHSGIYIQGEWQRLGTTGIRALPKLDFVGRSENGYKVRLLIGGKCALEKSVEDEDARIRGNGFDPQTFFCKRNEEAAAASLPEGRHDMHDSEP